MTLPDNHSDSIIVLFLRTMTKWRYYGELFSRQELISKPPKKRLDRPIVVSVPKGCRCAVLDASFADAFVLLKDIKKISNKLKRVHLNQNTVVLNRQAVSTSLLRTAFAKCSPEIEVYSGLRSSGWKQIVQLQWKQFLSHLSNLF